MVIYSAYTQQLIVDEPWEAEDLPSSYNQKDTINTTFNHYISYPLLEMINWYQDEVSPNSIQRCIFNISCSNFAEIAISKYGLVGLLFFIDRYFYRENSEAYIHYPRIIKKNGQIKLDDKEFLYY